MFFEEAPAVAAVAHLLVVYLYRLVVCLWWWWWGRRCRASDVHVGKVLFLFLSSFDRIEDPGNGKGRIIDIGTTSIFLVSNVQKGTNSNNSTANFIRPPRPLPLFVPPPSAPVVTPRCHWKKEIRDHRIVRWIWRRIRIRLRINEDK